ncbi:MAG: hypothetical protein AAF153_01695 [Pseudomonadota bacterium]
MNMSIKSQVKPYEFNFLDGEVVLKFASIADKVVDKHDSLDRVFKEKLNAIQSNNFNNEIDQFLAKNNNDGASKQVPMPNVKTDEVDPFYDQKLIMTESELKQQVDAGHAKGFKEGYEKRDQEAKLEMTKVEVEFTQQKKVLADQLTDKEFEHQQQLSKSINDMSDKFSEFANTNNLKQGAIDTAISFSHDLVRKVIKSKPTEYFKNVVEDVVNDVMPSIIKYPQIRVTAPSTISTKLEQYVAEVKAKYNYAGEITIDASGDSDDQICNVSWMDGFATIDMENIWQQVDDIIGKSVANSNKQQPASAIPTHNNEPTSKVVLDKPTKKTAIKDISKNNQEQVKSTLSEVAKQVTDDNKEASDNKTSLVTDALGNVSEVPQVNDHSNKIDEQESSLMLNLPDIDMD